MYTYRGKSLGDFGFLLDVALTIVETAATAVSVTQKKKDTDRFIRRAEQTQTQELAHRESLKDQEIAEKTRLLGTRTQAEKLENLQIKKVGLLAAILFASVGTLITLVIYKVSSKK